MKYEFVTVHAYVDFAYTSFIDPDGQNYRDIVKDMAEKGWRFVGCVPVEQNGYGKVVAIDLVFEQ